MDKFIPKIQPSADNNNQPLWFIFYQDQLLFCSQTEENPLPTFILPNEIKKNLQYQQYLGIWQNYNCFCAELNSPLDLTEFTWKSLRQIGQQVNEELFHLMGRALQIIHWDKDHQFCSKCGHVLDISLTERAKICPACRASYFPRLSPCIIVLIKRQTEILLARSPHFKVGMYSTIAGFIEPGETAEQTVHREVFEEVGIKIKNLHYRFSQPWPFSDSLMLGFTAEYNAGEIVIDGNEIEDAAWFSIDNLPLLPSSMSISRRLIDLFINKEF